MAQLYSKARAQKRSPLAIASLVSGTAEPPAPGVVNWMSLSVSTVWIVQGTAKIKRRSNAPERAVVAFSCSSTKANVEVRSMANKHVQLAPFGADLGNVRYGIADWVALERLLRRPVAVDIRQAADAVALQATMQRRPRNMRDCWLQCIEAVIERRLRMLAKGNDNGFLLDGEYR